MKKYYAVGMSKPYHGIGGVPIYQTIEASSPDEAVSIFLRTRTDLPMEMVKLFDKRDDYFNGNPAIYTEP